MVLKVLKNNNLALSYERTSEEGKKLNRSQKFDFIPKDATDDELLAIGNAIKDVLENATKEMIHNLSFIVTED